MIGPASHFDDGARAATNRHRDRLRALQSTVERHLPVRLSKATFLCSPYPEPAGQTFGSHGAVFIAETLMLGAPARVVDAVGIHEGVHLSIGRDLRESIRRCQPEPYELLHEHLITDWLSGRIPFECDRNYVADKGWRLLYDSWLGPTSIEHDKAVDAVCDFFDAVSRGHASLRDSSLFVPPPPAYRAIADRWDGPLVRQYERHRAEVAVMVATGFELAHYFSERLRDRLAPDLWLIEEGFANFVSTSLTDVALDEIQRYAPQDRMKLELARRVSRLGVTVEDVLENTATLHGMAEYAKSLSIR